jgi:GT2 family glycosyltransferase
VGPWNEDFFLYSEESDFFLRARDRDFSMVYVPEATAMHRNGDLVNSPRLWSMLAVNRVRFYAMRHSRLQAILFRMVVILNEGLRSFRDARHRAAFAALVLPSRQPPEIRSAGIAERRAHSAALAGSRTGGRQA